MSAYSNYFIEAKKATSALIGLGNEKITAILTDVAAIAIAETAFLLSENEKDLALMKHDDPKHDRLQLTGQRIADIANEIKNVIQLENPIGEVLSKKEMPNGLKISKIRVPLGVVGIIYEARPNVTFDVFSLCFKTGNVVVLKGGSDAENSNKAIVKLIKTVLKKHDINESVITLLPSERAATDALLKANDHVDVLIPRGSQSLINFVRLNSSVPVIETGAGIVHTYGDESADVEKLTEIVFNAKTRRPSVCNSLDCLILHQNLLKDLPEIVKPLAEKEVAIFADDNAFHSLLGYYPVSLLHKADEKHFGTEYLSLQMAVKTVADIEEALAHILKYSSKHSEAIVAENAAHIELFLNSVDAAAVYANASTAFTDGAQFGLGAEIGISTQKLHARGPMGLAELTSYKWVIRGDGQVRI